MSGGKRKKQTTDATTPLDDPWFEDSDADPAPGSDPSKPIEIENVPRERKERGAIPKLVL